MNCSRLSSGLVHTLVTARSRHFTRRSNVSTHTFIHTLIGQKIVVRGGTNKNDAVARRLTGRFCSPATSGIVRHLLRGPVR